LIHRLPPGLSASLPGLWIVAASLLHSVAVTVSSPSIAPHLPGLALAVGATLLAREAPWRAAALAPLALAHAYAGWALSPLLAAGMPLLIAGAALLGHLAARPAPAAAAADDAAEDDSAAEEAEEEYALPPRRERPPGTLSVLLVEDDDVSRLLVRTLLERDGHEVTEAHDGEEAVDYAAEGGFDLVLMDIRLPGMGGVAATRRIRELPDAAAAAVPVVAMTAALDADRVDRYRAAGMAYAVPKPVERDRLRALLAEISGAPAPAADAGAPAVPGDSGGLMDRGVLDGHLRLLGSVRVAGIADSFLAAAPETVARIREAAEAGDLHALARSAHKLGSGALTVGLPRLSELAYAVERHGDAGEGDAALDRARDLLECFGRSAEALSAYRAALPQVMSTPSR